MEANRILFPAPSCEYSAKDFKELIWIPNSEGNCIPCIYLDAINGSGKILIYFHGNAEDIGTSFDIVDMLRTVIGMNVLSVEYPGYGIYKGKSKECTIIKDAETVYNFVSETLGYQGKNILVFGRSIGTGPATYLARHYETGCLFLMSAYTSIKQVARHLGGRLGAILIKERFRNIDNMPFIKCPTFLVHGIRDRLIPYSHSQKLQEACEGPCALFLPQDMDHNRFDYCDDLVLPMSTFLAQSGIEMKLEDGEMRIEVDRKYYQLPPCMKFKKTNEKIIEAIKKLT